MTFTTDASRQAGEVALKALQERQRSGTAAESD